MLIRGVQPKESRHSARLRKGPRAALGLRTTALSVPVFVLAAQLLAGMALAGQKPAPSTPADATTHAAAHSTTHRRKKTAVKKPAPAPVPPAAPVTPPAPPLPNWPANKKPNDANVTWDSHGLLIQASNSSLDQILRDVALKTGATIEGMGADERIFGSYGPGPARDVLNQLLDGTGYNILMVGDQGGDTPLRIVLSGRPTGAAAASGGSNTGNDGNSENDQESGQTASPAASPSPNPNPVAPAVPVRTPQQMFEYRQQMIQLRQQQESPQSQPN